MYCYRMMRVRNIYLNCVLNYIEKNGYIRNFSSELHDINNTEYKNYDIRKCRIREFLVFSENAHNISEK